MEEARAGKRFFIARLGFEVAGQDFGFKCLGGKEFERFRNPMSQLKGKTAVAGKIESLFSQFVVEIGKEGAGGFG